MTDPHRGRCWYQEGKSLQEMNWFELLDWAVYHAEGWEEWQEFREGLVGSPMNDRASRIEGWLLHHSSVADTVRCLNLTRSLRGQWSKHPEIVSLNHTLNQRYAQIGAA